jgi:HSP20 family protein
MAIVRRSGSPSGTFPSLFDWGLPATGWWPRFDDLFSDGDGRRLLLVDEFEEDGMLVVRAELPGLDPDKDVEISVANGYLTITAQHTEQEEKREKHFHRKEIRSRGVYRELPVPEGVTDSDVKASYKDGVLEVRLPLPPAVKTEVKRVPVTRA